MIDCVINVLIVAIILLIILFITQKVLEQFGVPMPWQLIYLLAGLIVLLLIVECLLGSGAYLRFHIVR